MKLSGGVTVAVNPFAAALEARPDSLSADIYRLAHLGLDKTTFHDKLVQERDRDSAHVVKVLAEAFSANDQYIQDTVMMTLAEDQANGYTGNWLLSKAFAKALEEGGRESFKTIQVAGHVLSSGGKVADACANAMATAFWFTPAPGDTVIADGIAESFSVARTTLASCDLPGLDMAQSTALNAGRYYLLRRSLKSALLGCL